MLTIKLFTQTVGKQPFDGKKFPHINSLAMYRETEPEREGCMRK